ncbi:MAG: hypothetical protein WCH43_17275 [Verrucomicrobiota bacterium]
MKLLRIRWVKLKGLPVFGALYYDGDEFLAMCFSTDVVAGRFEEFTDKQPAPQPDTSRLNAGERAQAMLAHINALNGWTAFYQNVLKLEGEIRARLAGEVISVDSDNAVHILWARDKDFSKWELLLEDWVMPSALAPAPARTSIPVIGMPERPRFNSDLVPTELEAHGIEVAAEVKGYLEGTDPLDPIPLNPDDILDDNI